MVFEFSHNAPKVAHNPAYMFLEAVFLTFSSTVCSYLIFPIQYISLGILVFITMGAIPLFSRLFSYNSYLSNYNKPFIKRHSGLISALIYFFLGVFVSYVLLFFILSINYSVKDYNLSDSISVTGVNNHNYKILINEINSDYSIISLIENNKVLDKKYFEVSDYIKFSNYKLEGSYLITNIADKKLTLSVGSGLRESIFDTQINEVNGVNDIRDSLTGEVSGSLLNKNKFGEAFHIIFRNNLGVIFKAAILSFFYGAGAIFLIAWNASILATVISLDIFVSMAPVICQGFIGIIKGFFNALYLFIGYIPHGLPELVAYFIVSFAGAMFARDLFKGLFTTEFKWVVIRDFVYLIVLALILLLIGALIEASYFL